MIITLAIIGFLALVLLIIYIPWRHEIRQWFLAGRFRQNKFLIAAILIVALASGLTLYFVLSTNRSPEAGLAEKPVSADLNKSTYTLELGTTMPPLSLPNTDNELIEVASLSGKILVLAFSNSQCQYCSQHLKELRELDSSGAGEVAIVLVNVLEPPATVRDYIDKEGIDFPVLVDSDGQTLISYQIKGIPTTFFVRQGVICGQLPGQVSVADMQASLAACRLLIPSNN